MLDLSVVNIRMEFEKLLGYDKKGIKNIQYNVIMISITNDFILFDDFTLK